MPEIIVLGGSGHAKVLISILKKAGYPILGYVDPEDHGPVLGIQRLGNDEILPRIRHKYPDCQAAIGIGKIDIRSDLRCRLQKKLEDLGFVLPPIVSPQAVVNEEVEIGAGTVVFDGVVINSGARIGSGCIINTNSTVEHDCRLEDHVHIASGAVLSGGVYVGRNSMIGTGVKIVQNVSICENCLIGAGATVVKDIAVSGIYTGTPATGTR